MEFLSGTTPSASLDYSQAIAGDQCRESSRRLIPAYDGTQYPTADASLHSGYLTGNCFDPAHASGRRASRISAWAGNSRYIIFAWYVYTGRHPFWLLAGGLRAIAAVQRSTVAGG